MRENPNPTQVTTKGYNGLLQKREELIKELGALRKDRASTITDQSTDKDGDHEAEREEKRLSGMLLEINAQIDGCIKVVPENQEEKILLGNGFSICFIDADPNRQLSFIMDGVNTYPQAVSLESPLGLAVFNQKVGDIVEVKNGKNSRVKILEIKAPGYQSKHA